MPSAFLNSFEMTFFSRPPKILIETAAVQFYLILHLLVRNGLRSVYLFIIVEGPVVNKTHFSSVLC